LTSDVLKIGTEHIVKYMCFTVEDSQDVRVGWSSHDDKQESGGGKIEQFSVCQ